LGMRKRKAIAVIPARYNSSRLPGKPLISIKGKPLIQRVYEKALKSKLLDGVLVATDNQKVRDLMESLGGEVKLTSKNHPTGTDRVAEAVKDIPCDIVLNIQCDEPFLDPRMVDDLVRLMRNKKDLKMATLAYRIKDPQLIYDPNIVKVVLDQEDFALYFSRMPVPFHRTDGKSANKLFFYEHIGIYAFRKSFLLRFAQLPQGPLEITEKLEQLRALENGYKIKVLVTKYNSRAINSSFWKMELRPIWI
jgi:3-deoxy-manno-octulosonate cytidylyltransferase (CMP-KDO synthetase)